MGKGLLGSTIQLQRQRPLHMNVQQMIPNTECAEAALLCRWRRLLQKRGEAVTFRPPSEIEPGRDC